MRDTEFTRVPVADWDRLVATLRAFDGTVSVDADDGVELTAGGARFRVTRDGAVDAGMPLHAFDGHADELLLDPDGGRIRVTGDVQYEFRLP